MTWSFSIEGQPPSVNNMYIKARGRVIKDPVVETYQVLVTMTTKLKRPKGWEPIPKQQIRIYYDFFLKRDADCDNLLKALNDAIAIGLGVNDKVFLPCVRKKAIDGRWKPRVDISIDDGVPDVI